MAELVRQTAQQYGKPVDELRLIGTSAEPATLDLGTDQTPIGRFFICAMSPAPDVAPAEWSLQIDGDAAMAPRSVGIDELRALPQRRVRSWLECAGNGRAMFEVSGGYERPEALTDTPWTLGAMGMATWVGPTLASVLELAGVSEDAEWVGPVGLDVDSTEGAPASMSIPVAKARHEDTLVALEMNDAPLLRAHGAPARLLVPGWVGAYSVKWLDRLEVSSTWVSSFRSDVYYRHRNADGEDQGPLTSHPVKSTLALPWPAEIQSGSTVIRGYARCGTAPIERLEWSVDDGPWQDISFAPATDRWAWQPFEFTWEAPVGAHQIRTRATAADGQTQPDSQPYHPNTVLWNSVTRHPITVIA